MASGEDFRGAVDAGPDEPRPRIAEEPGICSRFVVSEFGRRSEQRRGRCLPSLKYFLKKGAKKVEFGISKGHNVRKNSQRNL
ncbi:protein of unknown function (plasmid) [Paraburkholderia kururiensis]